jgi:hypothetical protein
LIKVCPLRPQADLTVWRQQGLLVILARSSHSWSRTSAWTDIACSRYGPCSCGLFRRISISGWDVPTGDSNRISIHSTPSPMPRRLPSAARRMPDGRCCEANTMTADFPAATRSGRPACGGRERTLEVAPRLPARRAAGNDTPAAFIGTGGRFRSERLAAFNRNPRPQSSESAADAVRMTVDRGDVKLLV